MRRTPMIRTGFKPRVKPMSGILRAANLSAQKPIKRMKSSRPRMTPIRASACTEECTLRLPGVCNFDTETTVLCHENGAGAGMKSPDECGAYGCYACHMVLDGHAKRPEWLTREMVQAAFVEGNRKTRLILKQKGLIQ